MHTKTVNFKFGIHYSNAIYIIDIDECKMSNGGCEHHCTNNNGSFFCTCNAGFTLNKDHLGCTGMYVCCCNSEYFSLIGCFRY